MDQFLVCFAVLFLVILTVEGQRYGYKKTKIDPVVVPIKKLPLCHIPCTREFISPECREETFGFENGRRCKGCDRDICRGDNWDLNRGLDRSRWQNGLNWRNNDFLDQRQNNGNAGTFMDRLQNGFPSRRQGTLFGERRRNGFVSNNFGNRALNNQWL